MRCLKIPDIQIIVRSGLQRSGSIAEHLCTHSHIVAVSPTSSCGVDRQNSLHGDNYSVHYKGGIVTRACNQLPPLPPPFFFKLWNRTTLQDPRLVHIKWVSQPK